MDASGSFRGSFHELPQNMQIVQVATLSSPSWPCLFTLSFNVFNSLLSLLLRNFNISTPFLIFVTYPCCPMFSFGLLVFPILELTSLTTTVSLLALYTFFVDLLPLFLRTSSVSLFPHSSTLGACSGFFSGEYDIVESIKQPENKPWPSL